MKRVFAATGVSLLLGVAVVATIHKSGEASDHDDGETDVKARALNLTDHFAFKSPANPAEMSIITYFNPRSLPSRQYTMSTQARYEQHVTKLTGRADAPTGKDDYVFRFEAGAPNPAGVQDVKLTVLKDNAGTLTEVGSSMGKTTDFASSKSGAITTNTANIGGMDVKWFIGQRADSFHFDVVRFFQVRSFLAARFFGGDAPNKGTTNTGLANNCRGDEFLALGAAKEANGVADHDVINLFNPPSCAPDFTKDLNVTAIVLNVPIAQLGGTVFDTWSSISVPE